jgi:hypothetical protein
MINRAKQYYLSPNEEDTLKMEAVCSSEMLVPPTSPHTHGVRIKKTNTNVTSVTRALCYYAANVPGF